MHSSRMRTGRSLTYAGVCFPGGGVFALGGVSAPGVYLLQGGVCSRGSALGGSALGVSAPRGMYAQGGVCLGDVESQHALRQTPPPPVDRITDACKNITLAQLRCSQ